jgi:hypothetical protein
MHKYAVARNAGMAGALPTSRRVLIGELAAIEFGDSPRVDVMGVVVAADNSRPASFVADDGSGLILVRRFDSGNAPGVGQPVCVIGRLRDSGERYIACEVAKVIDAIWLEVRKLELAKRPVPEAAPAPVAVADEDAESGLLVLIRTLDTGEGALLDDVIQQAGPDAERKLRLMMSKGDIYELSPGRIKILE